MGWNDPGDGNRDPWSGSGRDRKPPDLGAWLEKVRERLGKLSGRGRGGGSGIFGMTFLLLLLAAVWLASGFYTVNPGQRAVLVVMGRFQGTVGPGLHWHWPYPIASAQLVAVDSRRSLVVGADPGSRARGNVLTQDENRLQIQATVQWQVKDAGKYLFGFQDPERALRELLESALRGAVAGRQLDEVLGQGLEAVEAQARETVSAALARHDAGMEILGLKLEAQVPEPVLAAYRDAQQAREEERQSVAAARAEGERLEHEGRRQADRLREDAGAYRATVVAAAQGDAARFLAVYEQYRKAPQVTRDRLYLETLEEVLARSGKIIVDARGAQPVIHLPALERGQGAPAAAPQAGGEPQAANPQTGGSAGADGRDRQREREAR